MVSVLSTAPNPSVAIRTSRMPNPTARTNNEEREFMLIVQRILISMIKNVVRYVTLSFCLGSMIACTQGSGHGVSASPKLETEDQKMLYALGLLVGRNIKPFALNPEELAIVKAGLTDAVTDTKPQVEMDTYGPKVNELAQKRAASGADEAKKKGQEFADNVAKQK